METITIRNELGDLVNGIASITDNYYRSGDSIINRDNEPVAMLKPGECYAGYFPLNQKRLVEIDILRKVYHSRVMVVPATLLVGDLMEDHDLVDMQWYQFFYLLREEWNKKDAVKKKVLFHMRYLYDVYVIYYMLTGRRTPEKVAAFLNTFVDFMVMQDEVDAIEEAAKLKRIREFNDFDLPQWREFNKDYVHNETGILYFRYIAHEKAFEETSGSKIHQSEMRRFWNQYTNTGSSAVSVFSPACEMPRLLSVTPTRDGNLMIDGMILTPEELDRALMQIQD